MSSPTEQVYRIPSATEHVKDDPNGLWEIFDRVGGGFHLELPRIFGFQITKFMVLELIAAGLMLAIFIPLARRSRAGHLPKGGWWNAFESLLTFVRDEIAKPNLGDHEADRFVPYLWTVFLFVLFCNLLGMFPYMGSPTANMSVTGALALCSFVLMHAAPIVKMGPIHYLQSIWPHIDLPFAWGIGWAFGMVIKLMIFVLELISTVIKSFVLAVRLFANMFAGHMVLATILLFIVIVGNAGFTAIWPVVTVGSVLGVVALSLLELFVAFLQAYIFAFLTALFVGMALHPSH